MFCTKCGLELPDDAQFCRKCGYAFPISPTQLSATAPVSEQPIAPTQPTPAQSTFNFGTLVFAGFSVLSLVVCFAKGIVPIYFAEAALWAALAWYWNKKGSTSETATLIILLCAVTVAAGEGYLIGRDSKVTPRTLPADFWADVPEAKKQGTSPVAGDIWAKAEAELQGAQPAAPPNPPPGYVLKQPKKAKPSPILGYASVATYEENIYQRCAFNTGSTPCLMVDGPENDFSGRLATLKRDDRVEILSAKIRAPNGKEIYEVRFQKWTGWMDADSLTLEVPGAPSSNNLFSPNTSFAASVPAATQAPIDAGRQAELEQLAQAADKSAIWTGYPNCGVVMESLEVTPTPASLSSIDKIQCGESFQILAKENQFYLVRTRRNILGYVVANAVVANE